MAKTPKPDLTTRRGAAAHVAVQDAVMDRAVQSFHAANRKFASLVADADKKHIRASILEEYRFAALVAYEAMLDAMINTRHALTILDAARSASPAPKPKRPEA